MKNLKRALSLVLSTAMMVGMMVVGTGATFTDVAESDHKEAIEVMSMVGIMKGVSETEFAPEADVTRDQMAVIMCNLLDLKLNGTHPFTDVADWADDYVGAIYINGYTAGKTATTYGGSDKITTAEAALMIMRTLGYFEYQGEFGGDWFMATVKRATELQLFKDIDAGVKETLNRGEVAQMVLNALDENVVLMKEYGGLNVSGDGFSVTEKATYEPTYIRCDVKGHNHNIDLAEKLYGTTLNDVNTKDDFGRPAVKWTYTGAGKDQSVVVADEATVVFTAKTNKDNVTKALKEYNLEPVTHYYENEDGTTGSYVTGANYYVDGKYIEDVTDKAKLYDVEEQDGSVTNGITANGATVEIYVNEDLDITDIVVVNEFVGKVTKINKADEASATKRSVVLEYNADLTFETEDFAKKDMVIYTKAWDGAKYVVKSMAAAEYVEGKITAVSEDYVKIDGVSYKLNPLYNAEGNDALNLGDDVKIYVDSYGYLRQAGKVDAAAPAINEFVIVTAVGADNFGTKQIKVLKTDGTTAVVGIEDKDGYITADTFTADAYVGQMLIMKDADSDGKAEFKARENNAGEDEKFDGFDLVDATSLNSTKDNLNNGWSIADDAVVFVEKMEWVDELDENEQPTGNKVLASKGEWTVITGAKLAVADAANVTVAYANKADTGFYAADLLYVQSTVSSSSDVLYGYVTEKPATVKNADDEQVFEITFWNGTAYQTLLTANDDTRLAKGQFFSYKLTDGEISAINEDVTLSVGAITAFDGEKIMFLNDSNKYDVDEDTVIIYVNTEDVEGEEDGAISRAEENEEDGNDVTKTYFANVMYAIDSSDNEDVLVLIVDTQGRIGVEIPDESTLAE